MQVLLNICDLDYSSGNKIDDEIDKYDNVKNNEDLSENRLDYTEYFSKEDKHDENQMYDDEMYDLIGGYKIDDLSIEVEYEVTVLGCDIIKIYQEEKCTYVRIVKSLSETDKMIFNGQEM